uniref:Uncharacterized protein n=1 Tax=Siphoviridae sp. ctnFo11 TaxID=2826454 RepID=A0A8S5N690_9CAUD|nr:MAG TPA: hypothetical protein [Siphoviridae sp. ctnFo11]
MGREVIFSETSLFYALNWYKSTEILLYNYGMRLEIYHLAERK